MDSPANPGHPLIWDTCPCKRATDPASVMLLLIPPNLAQTHFKCWKTLLTINTPTKEKKLRNNFIFQLRWSCVSEGLASYFTDHVHWKVSEELLTDCLGDWGVKRGKHTEYMWNADLSFRWNLEIFSHSWGGSVFFSRNKPSSVIAKVFFCRCLLLPFIMTNLLSSGRCFLCKQRVVLYYTDNQGDSFPLFLLLAYISCSEAELCVLLVHITVLYLTLGCA